LMLGLVFYVNTLDNDYALDDGLVIYDNPFTTQGISGISEIFTHDSYYGYYQKFGSKGELSGGRYRPLSIATFALEWAFFGRDPMISHAVNLLLYLLTLVLLLRLLRRHWFPGNRWVPFLTVLLFAIHPIHTEVVANIKSRDEIMSLLFLVLSMDWLFRSLKETKAARWMVLSVLAYLLALFSKENGITFLAVFPLALYVFARLDARHAIRRSLPFLLPAAVYLLVRFQVVGFGAPAMDDVMNDPFKLATPAQKYATVFYILLYYIRLLVFPHPLSYDYGYDQFHYREFSDTAVIFSIVFQGGLLVYALLRLRKREPLAFAILFYFITLSIVSNLFVNLGGTMGERLIYLSSLGFALAVVLALQRLFQQVDRSAPALARYGAFLFGLTVILTSGFKTINRNQAWKDNTTLFITDVKAVPNSVKANTAAATAYVSLADKATSLADREYYLEQAIICLKQAQSIYPNFADIYMNLGTVYFRQEKYEKAERAWLYGQKLQPNHPNLPGYFDALGSVFYRQGLQAGAKGNYDKAVELLEKAAHYHPNDAEVWYNLGGARFSAGKLKEARQAFQKALQLDPKNKDAQSGLNAVNSLLQSPNYQ